MPIVNPILPADGDAAVVSPYNTAILAILGVMNGFIDADNLASGAVTTSRIATGAINPTVMDAYPLVEGGMAGGQIVPSVSSNNLTLSVKTIAGTNPTNSSPVYVRIGNTIRSITSALSVTVAAGTNYFGMGSASFATFESDYFAYLGYNATDGVVLGFARIPYAITYSDFSSTSTNDNYCAISTITHASASDQYEVVGRFNAILGATSSFNWSLPGTTVIINRPIYETRPLPYAAVNTGFSAVPSGAIYIYKISGRLTTLFVSQPNNGTSNSTGFTITLPLTAYTLTNMIWVGQGQITDNGTVVTTPGLLYILSAATTLTVYKDWAGTVFTSSGNKRLVIGTITYETV